MAKDKAPRVTSPRGILRFPKLVVPDEYLGKKSFVTGLIVPEEPALKFIEVITKAADAFYVKAKAEAKAEIENSPKDKRGKAIQAAAKLETFRMHEPWDLETDRETGEPTGNYVFDFKAVYQWKDKKTGEMKTNAIKFFDAFRNPCKVNPWGGTEAVISADLAGFSNPATEKYGISLRIAAIQIIQLRQGGSGSNNGADYGFAAEEDGFAAGEGSADEPTSEPSPADADSGNGDF